MTREKWINLAVAAIIVFYTIQIVLDFAWGTMCGHIGADYCNTWTAGRIANTLGYRSIYDVRLIGQVERGIFPQNADPALFVVTPSPYLPLSVPPFQFLALISPAGGYIIWTLLNLAVMILYLRFLVKRLAGKPPDTRMLTMIMASLPVFFNVFYGNVALWLMVCVGEFMRALVEGKPFRAGLWLSGLLLKPPLLILLGLILLVQREVRILAALAASATAALGISLLLVGPAGFEQMIGIWLRSAAGQPSDGVESMMNWRMVGTNLSAFTAPWLAWSFAGVGMLVTLVVTLYVWRQPLEPRLPALAPALLGILAASTVLAWHSHVHTALVLVPPLLLLQQQKAVQQNVIDAWVLAPALLFIAVLVPENLLRLNLLPISTMHVVFFMRGGGEFAACLFLFCWAVNKTRGQTQAR